jgi:hypothetical protein
MTGRFIFDVRFVFFICTFFCFCNSKNTTKQNVFTVKDSAYSVTNKDSLRNTKVSLDERLIYYDTISLSRISIKGIHLGESVEHMINRLGKSDSIKTTINEMGGYEYINYYYSKSYFSIHNQY